MLRTLWIVTVIGSIIGLIFLIMALFSFSESSVNVAALAAVGVGFATIPYCLARAKSALRKTSKPPAEAASNE